MNENGDTFDTRAWLFEHFNHPDTARISFLATLRCVVWFVVVWFVVASKLQLSSFDPLNRS